MASFFLPAGFPLKSSEGVEVPLSEATEVFESAHVRLEDGYLLPADTPAWARPVGSGERRVIVAGSVMFARLREWVEALEALERVSS